MKFGVHVRVDHATKLGGDTALARSFVARLLTLGHHAELVTGAVELRLLNPDVLLAFNIDQPLELLAICQAARARSCHVAVYTLHHPRSGVAAYLASGLPGARGFIARLAQADPARYFQLMALLRSLRKGNLLDVKNGLRSQNRTLADIAKCVDDLLVSGPSEEVAIRAAIPAFDGVVAWHVPHPVDIALTPDVKLKSGIGRLGRHFLVAGRIETRKNTLAVLEIASRFSEDRFVFAGAINETEPAYAKAFKAGLLDAPNCEWLGQLSLPSLLSAISNADAVLSPSWFEVMSLINLFAFALKTPVISSHHSYDMDLLGSNVVRFAPEKKGDLARVLGAWEVPDPCIKSIEALTTGASDFKAHIWSGFDQWLAHLEKSPRKATQ